MSRRLFPLALLWAAAAGAQPTMAPPRRAPVTAAPPPVAAPARATAGDTSTTSYTVAGIPVIHRRTASNNVVANLYLLGGVREVSDADAGIEPFLLNVSEQGTAAYPKQALRRAMARTGSEIDVAALEDWTVIGLRTTTAAFDSAWAVFADRVRRPRLEPAEVAFVRERLLSALQQRGDSPDGLLDQLADSVAWAGHPYGRSPVGTVASIRAMTPAALRAWHAAKVVRSRMLLVVVGNVPRAALERAVTRTLGALPEGSYRWSLPAPTPRWTRAVAISERALPTNYLSATYRGPAAGTRDAHALRLATAVLSGQLFSEIRSKRNLTYSVNAPYRDRALVSGGLYVTTTQPDSVLMIMRQQIQLVQSVVIPREALAPLILQFITEYFLDNETSAAQADYLARAQLYRGDWRAGDRFIAELEAVTGEDIQRAARTYWKDMRWAYVGDPRQVNRGLLGSF